MLHNSHVCAVFWYHWIFILYFSNPSAGRRQLLSNLSIRSVSVSFLISAFTNLLMISSVAVSMRLMKVTYFTCFFPLPFLLYFDADSPPQILSEYFSNNRFDVRYVYSENQRYAPGSRYRYRVLFCWRKSSCSCWETLNPMLVLHDS